MLTENLNVVFDSIMRNVNGRRFVRLLKSIANVENDRPLITIFT